MAERSDSQQKSLRSQRARIAALAMHAKYDGTAITAKARRAFLDSFETQVDPEGKLSPSERSRRAAAARRAHFLKLAMKSAKVRARRNHRL